MRTVIILGGMAIVLFGLAAGATIVLQGYFQDKDKGPHGGGDSARDSAQATGRDKDLGPPIRAGDGPKSNTGSSQETEQILQEMAKLHEREEAIAKQEQQLAARRRSLELIKDDIKSQREEIDKLRKEVSEQDNDNHKQLEAAELKVKELEHKREEEQKLLSEAKRGVYEAEGVRTGNLKRVSGIADSTEPAEVAAILERMVESGSTGLMTAAQLLANMKDRRAAAALSAIQDKALAADLLEKMIGLKQATSGGAANPVGGKPPRTPPPGDSK